MINKIYETCTLNKTLSKLSEIQSNNWYAVLIELVVLLTMKVIQRLIYQLWLINWYKYVFQRKHYDYYCQIDCATIAKIVKKSKYLIQSEQQIESYGDDDLLGYGIKLANTTIFCDPDWKEMEVSDDEKDCAIADFSRNVTFVPHESIVKLSWELRLFNMLFSNWLLFNVN